MHIATTVAQCMILHFVSCCFTTPFIIFMCTSLRGAYCTCRNFASLPYIGLSTLYITLIKPSGITLDSFSRLYYSNIVPTLCYFSMLAFT